jgi:RIO-like serine/threonine protein kinase
MESRESEATNATVDEHPPMARLLSADAALMGRLSSYTIAKELHRAADEGAVYLARNQSGERCIVKSIRGHWRLRNEADILKRYQAETPFLRPLVDEIHEPADPPSIVLRYLDSDVLTESNKKRLSRPEIKQVARCVLEALRVLHRDGLVHTGGTLSRLHPRSLNRRLLNPYRCQAGQHVRQPRSGR